MAIDPERYVEPEPTLKSVYRFMDEEDDVLKVDDRVFPGEPPRLIIRADTGKHTRGVWLDLDTVRLLVVSLIGWLKEHAPEEGLIYKDGTEDGTSQGAAPSG